MNENSGKKGFLKAIIIIIIALAILTYFGLDLSKLFTASGPQNLLNSLTAFLEWAVGLVIHYWNLLVTYLKGIQHS